MTAVIGVWPRWAYRLPLVLRVKLSARESLRQSVQYTRGNWILALLAIGGFWFLLSLGSNAISASVLGLGRLVVPLVGTRTGLSVLIILLGFGTVGLTGLVSGTVGMVLRTPLINRLFDQVSGVRHKHLPPPSGKDRKTFRRVTLGIVFGALIVLTLSATWWLRRRDFTDPVLITAHRGSSSPLPKIRSAPCVRPWRTGRISPRSMFRPHWVGKCFSSTTET